MEFVQLLVTLDPEQRVHQGSHLLSHPYLQGTPTMLLSSPDMAQSQQVALGEGTLQQPPPMAPVPVPGSVAPVDLARMVPVPGLNAVHCDQDAPFVRLLEG